MVAHSTCRWSHAVLLTCTQFVHKSPATARSLWAEKHASSWHGTHRSENQSATATQLYMCAARTLPDMEAISGGASESQNTASSWEETSAWNAASLSRTVAAMNNFRSS
ncbi:hypothetical protein CAOG_009442 [Capsaspora owczarzaki ATCC 30864]|uniref:Uncharacterized protein n=1 Tax=Capsaspora owczarzaki (strain ATCC 30864) TaxID=595528 RepID=A0A0D2VJQ9_CAPO3|nr:hypothetical protein CAOG_009442 [Capsaspora owczarzaki ATCC 30864]